MKYLILFICFIISSAVYAGDKCIQKDKNAPIDIYCKGQYVSSMTIDEWEAAWQMIDNYKKLKDIEDTLIKENKQVGKIDVELQDSIWNIIDNTTFSTFAIIKWIDGKDVVLKTLKVKIEINKIVGPDDYLCAKVKRIYIENVAPAGCITFGITTLILLLLL